MSEEDKLYEYIKNKNINDKFEIINTNNLICSLKYKNLSTTFIKKVITKSERYIDNFNLYFCVEEEFEEQFEKMCLINNSQIHLLGNDFSENFKSKYKGKIIILDVNILKYIAEHPDEIQIDNENKNNNNNEILKHKLLTEYNTALFWTNYDINIVGICGYKPFKKEYMKYLNTLKKIYIVECNDFFEIKHHPFKNENIEIEYIKNIDIRQLIKKYPYLIAYHRLKINYNTYYIDRFYDFKRIATVSNQIFIGCDIYIREWDIKFFKENNITDILNVSEDISYIKNNEREKYNYHNIPISECYFSENKKSIYCAIELLNKLIQDNKKIYVHCAAGVNRSPAVVILYLMKYQKYTMFEAYEKLAKLRWIWTMPSLLDIIYEYAKQTEKNPISPLFIINHEETIMNDDARMVFALYDYLHLHNIKF